MAAHTLRRLDAAQAPGAMLVEHCDIPMGMTIDEWRTAAAAERRAARDGRPGLRRTLRRVLRRR